MEKKCCCCKSCESTKPEGKCCCAGKAKTEAKTSEVPATPAETPAK